MARKIMIKFESEFELNRAQWVQLFCNSELARLVKAQNVSIHFGQRGAKNWSA